MIEPASALSTAAQIAVTLAGFAGVVVVFGRRTLDEWSRVDRFRLQLLLSTSGHALALCMGSMLLLATDLPEPTVWAWSSGVALVSLLPIGAMGWRRFRSFRPDEIQAAAVSKGSFYGVSSFALTSGALQIYNVLVTRAFWPFFTLIVVAILASTLQFVRMVLARPEAE
jgi:hypothetical protein